MFLFYPKSNMKATWRKAEKLAIDTQKTKKILWIPKKSRNKYVLPMLKKCEWMMAKVYQYEKESQTALIMFDIMNTIKSNCKHVAWWMWISDVTWQAFLCLETKSLVRYSITKRLPGGFDLMKFLVISKLLRNMDPRRNEMEKRGIFSEINISVRGFLNIWIKRIIFPTYLYEN